MEADGYIFLGCLASPSIDMFAYNYGRLKDWADRSENNGKWAREHAFESLAVGNAYREMFAAAQRGESEYVIQFEGHTFHRSLVRIRTETANPPADLFRYIHKPALVLQGAEDMNVPPADAEAIGQAIRSVGNPNVQVVMVSGVDHSFQYIAESEDDRMRDRHSFASFFRLYSPKLYAEVAAWLHDRFPSQVAATRPAELPRPGITSWNGIQVIDDVIDPLLSPGVETLEGRIGPLMKGDSSQAHFIDMPVGLYLHEHPHSSESIIYTVRGQWVLCSGGQRHLMKPGTLYWFKKSEPTGYEIPFDEQA